MTATNTLPLTNVPTVTCHGSCSDHDHCAVAGSQTVIMAEDWRKVIDSMPDSVMVLDLNHRILAVNPATLKATGHSEGELIGQFCYEIFHNTTTPPSGCPHLIMQNLKESKFVETEIETLNNTFLVSIMPLHNEDGAVTKAIHIARNFTEQKQAEENRGRREKMQGILEMAGAACHELSQPVQVISGFVEMLEMDLADDKRYTHSLEQIQREVDHLTSIIHKIQQITRYRTCDYIEGLKIVDIINAADENNLPQEPQRDVPVPV